MKPIELFSGLNNMREKTIHHYSLHIEKKIIKNGGQMNMKKLMKVYIIFNTAYINKADAIKVESEWSHKETIKEKYMLATDSEVETIVTEYGSLKIAHGDYVELDNKLFECILYLQRKDNNGSYVDMIEEYQDGEIAVSSIKDVCVKVLTDWMNEGTAPDDVKQIKELQEWIDMVNSSE